MMIAIVVTPWTGTGATEAPYRSLLADTFELASCSDVTGQQVPQIQPSPNAYTVEARCNPETLALIEADDRFVVFSAEEERTL